LPTFCQPLSREKDREKEKCIKSNQISIQSLFAFFSLLLSSQSKTQGAKVNSYYSLWQVYFLIISNPSTFTNTFTCVLDRLYPFMVLPVWGVPVGLYPSRFA
jgi:hypothetical protein